MGVPMELPNVNAVFISCTDNRVVVTWIEHYVRNWESVTNKCLIVVRRGFLCVIVPNFYQIV